MFRAAQWTGVLSIVMALGLSMLFPSRMGPLPSGMRTPILAFELARTPAEVETMFGPPQTPERALWRRGMNAGNYADFAFLLVYGAFFLTFSGALAASGGRFAKLALRLAALPSAMDVAENLQLLAITRGLGGDYSEALSRLRLFTWCKWGAIAAVCAAWIPGMWSRGSTGRVGAVLATLTVMATAWAFATRGVAAELMALGTALTMIAALTLAVRRPEAV